MARRRKKNPLLGKILVVTLIAHAIALPIAAHFGAFEKIKEQFTESRVTLVPLPKAQEEKPEVKKEKTKPKPTKVKSSSNAVKRSGSSKPNPNLQKVVAASASGPGADGPSIEQGTKTSVGEVPTEKASGTAKQADAGPSAPPTIPEKTTTAPPPPPPPPTTPTVPAETVKPKHVPVYVEAQQEYAPLPTIPDNLRVDSIDKDCVVLFTVGPDGKPTDVKLSQSTGNSDLDDLAVRTAKQWKFKPATLDGAGVESKVKLTVQFRVE